MSLVCAKSLGIEGEMRTILDANGFSGQPIGEAMDKLAKDPRFLYPNDDNGRAEALARYTELIKQATERSSKELFLTTPCAKIEVRRVPEFKEATAPGANYDIAAMDGSRPGIFFANLRDMNEVPKWSMPTLAYHEGVPGHHSRIFPLREELKGVPAISQGSPVYGVHGRLGALLRMAGETSRMVRQRSVRKPGTPP